MEDRVTRFRLVIDEQTLFRMGACSHGTATIAGCRCCEVNLLVDDFIGMFGKIEYSNQFIPEIASWARVIEGTVRSDPEKLALSALVAWARGDRDPLQLFVGHSYLS